MPSYLTSCLAECALSSSVTLIYLSMISKSVTDGIRFFPRPSIQYGYISFSSNSPVSWYFLRTDPYASTPITLMFGFFSFRYLAVPEIVPPVPLQTIKWVISPSVWFQISGPVDE